MGIVGQLVGLALWEGSNLAALTALGSVSEPETGPVAFSLGTPKWYKLANYGFINKSRQCLLELE